METPLMVSMRRALMMRRIMGIATLVILWSCIPLVFAQKQDQPPASTPLSPASRATVPVAGVLGPPRPDAALVPGVQSIEEGIVPRAGDWDGDQRKTPGIWRPRYPNWRLRNFNTSGGASLQFDYGAITDVPVVGDWNGDGVDTVGVFRPSDGTWYLRNSNN